MCLLALPNTSPSWYDALLFSQNTQIIQVERLDGVPKFDTPLWMSEGDGRKERVTTAFRLLCREHHTDRRGLPTGESACRSSSSAPARNDCELPTNSPGVRCVVRSAKQSWRFQNKKVNQPQLQLRRLLRVRPRRHPFHHLDRHPLSNQPGLLNPDNLRTFEHAMVRTRLDEEEQSQKTNLAEVAEVGNETTGMSMTGMSTTGRIDAAILDETSPIEKVTADEDESDHGQAGNVTTVTAEAVPDAILWISTRTITTITTARDGVGSRPSRKKRTGKRTTSPQDRPPLGSGCS